MTNEQVAIIAAAKIHSGSRGFVHEPTLFSTADHILDWLNKKEKK